MFQTPQYRLVYVQQSAVRVDIDGIFTRTLKLCWQCEADNDWLSRWRRKHLQSQWVRPQQMLMLLPEKLLQLQVDISRTPSINTVAKTNTQSHIQPFNGSSVATGECFFWYRPTRIVPDQRPLNSGVATERYVPPIPVWPGHGNCRNPRRKWGWGYRVILAKHRDE